MRSFDVLVAEIEIRLARLSHVVLVKASLRAILGLVRTLIIGSIVPNTTVPLTLIDHVETFGYDVIVLLVVVEAGLAGLYVLLLLAQRVAVPDLALLRAHDFPL